MQFDNTRWSNDTRILKSEYDRCVQCVLSTFLYLQDYAKNQFSKCWLGKLLLCVLVLKFLNISCTIPFATVKVSLIYTDSVRWYRCDTVESTISWLGKIPILLPSHWLFFMWSVSHCSRESLGEILFQQNWTVWITFSSGWINGMDGFRFIRKK